MSLKYDASAFAVETGSKENRISSSASRRMRIAMASLLALGVFGSGIAVADEQAKPVLEYEPVVAASQAALFGTSVPTVNFSADNLTEKTPNKWLVGGAMGLIIAALIKIVGANRVMNIVADAGPTLARAAEAIVSAPKMAAKALGSAVTSPIKFLMIVGGLAMIGFTGISIFDLHWGAGIATGIGMTAVTWLGTSKIANRMRRQKMRVDPEPQPSRSSF